MGIYKLKLYIPANFRGNGGLYTYLDAVFLVLTLTWLCICVSVGTLPHSLTYMNEANPQFYSESPVTLSISCHRYSSLIYLRNSRPVLWNLELRTEHELRRCKIVVTHSPDFAHDVEIDLDYVAPGSLYQYRGVCPRFDDERLLNLKEDVPGHIRVVAYTEDGTEFARAEDDFTWLAYNRWAGGYEYPELLAALTLPRDPAVDAIMEKVQAAAGVKEEWPGYAQSPQDVERQLSRLWDTVASYHLQYAKAPDGWHDDNVGQTVRTPSEIMEKRCCNCLDSALLFAACSARMGYNPFLVIISGHAFLGVQLENDLLTEPVGTPVPSVRNSLSQNKLLAFECTYVCADSGSLSFAKACEKGKQELEALKDDDFFIALDIRQLWEQVGICPIFGEPLPPRRRVVEEEPEIVSARPRTRMQNWQLKLLDLSLRNSLLNTQLKGKNQIQLLQPNVAALEDMLSAGLSFRVKAIPQTYWKLTSRVQYGEDSELLRAQLEDCVASMFARRELAVDMSDAELNSKITSLYNTARREMEESGANTLYIACGFLKWRRKDSSAKDKSYMAPLLLLPVRLTRPTVRAGFTLRGTDEESRMNMSLLELLKTEFGMRLPELEGDLPTDASGLDVERIFSIVRKAIRSMPDWEVVETCSLGVYSFTKYLMWKDLTDREEFLKRNPIVSQIAADRRSTFPEQVGFPDPATLDDDVAAEKVYTPMSSDSSQLSAVLAAARGKNFVLIGPPGTGKSQTITNMIVHCMGHGKSVLFVAEKSAALQVVHKRLKRVGLEDFCLEMHSNKANKKDVLEQFKMAVQAVSAKGAEVDWTESANTLSTLRNKLNLLPLSLHRKYDEGTSLYEDVQNIEKFSHLPVFATLPGDPTACTAEQRKTMEAAAHDLAKHYALLEDAPAECVQMLRIKDYSLSWAEELERALADYSRANTAREQVFLRLAEQLGADAESIRHRMDGLLPALQFIGASGGDDWAALLPSRAEKTMAAIKTLREHAAYYHQQRAKLSLPYPTSALDEPMLDAWLAECKRLHVSWFLPRFFGMMRMRTNLRSLALCRETPDCLSDLMALHAMRETRKAADAVTGLPEHLARGLAMADSDVEAARVAQQAFAAVQEMDEPMLERLMLKGSALTTPGAPARESLFAYVEKTAQWQQSRAALAQLLGHEGVDALPCGDAVAAWCESFAASRRNWRDVVIWNSCRATVEAAGFAPMADALLQGKCTPAQLLDAVRVNFSRSRIRAAVESAEALRNFSPKIHEATIGDFAEQDSRHMQLVTEHVRSELIKRAGGISQYGEETAILQREISKQKGHMPLRKLMGSLPNITRLLKPCMLMSPLSVAQYLDASTELFDVVIFDEASQIPVWDAIGAIGRGRNAIIVGDPRQMPPTSFFSRANQADADEDVVEQDMESILDECLACGIPSLNLTWHYRSKAESLISFSNAHYYEGKLTTFPAPMATDSAVSYHYTSGVYEPGSSKRINRAEAQALVEHLLAHLRADNFRYTEATSVGVVTFNAQQQALIQELLDAARAADESLEPYFSETNPEAVFVKNLENVQGDERGIIYFSTTYGRDSRGSISMNFGPLNLAGGERRLNVAVTRARCALHVFTSLRPEDIDLSRTKARGAADFRAFLDYARRGAASYLGLPPGGSADAEDALAAGIEAELTALGWRCTRNLGVSDFKVDLGVLHPQRYEELLAGISLDSATYAAANTARDRDVLRSSVLTSLGWRMLRVWALDWWQDRERVLQNLHAALNRCVELGPPQQPDMPELLPPPAPSTSNTPEPEPQKAVEEQAPLLGEVYNAYSPSAPLPPLFEMTDASLRNVVFDLLKAEAPIKLSFFYNRLREVTPTPTITVTIKNRLLSVLEKLEKDGHIATIPQDEDTLLCLATHTEPRPRACGPRAWSDVPDAELLLIADRVLAHLKCLAGTDAHLRGIATYLGISRLSAQFKQHLSSLLRTRI